MVVKYCEVLATGLPMICRKSWFVQSVMRSIWSMPPTSPAPIALSAKPTYSKDVRAAAAGEGVQGRPGR